MMREIRRPNRDDATTPATGSPAEGPGQHHHLIVQQTFLREPPSVTGWVDRRGSRDLHRGPAKRYGGVSERGFEIVFDGLYR